MSRRDEWILDTFLMVLDQHEIKCLLLDWDGMLTIGCKSEQMSPYAYWFLLYLMRTRPSLQLAIATFNTKCDIASRLRYYYIDPTKIPVLALQTKFKLGCGKMAHVFEACKQFRLASAQNALFIDDSKRVAQRTHDKTGCAFLDTSPLQGLRPDDILRFIHNQEYYVPSRLKPRSDATYIPTVFSMTQLWKECETRWKGLRAKPCFFVLVNPSTTHMPTQGVEGMRMHAYTHLGSDTTRLSLQEMPLSKVHMFHVCPHASRLGYWTVMDKSTATCIAIASLELSTQIQTEMNAVAAVKPHHSE